MIDRGRAGPGARINRRAAATLLGAVALAALAYPIADRVNGRAVRRQALDGAAAAARSGQVDLAIRNLGRYLDGHPEDLGVLEELARLSAESARTVEEATAAAAINDRLLRVDPEGPGRQETRRRLVDLYVRCGDWHRDSGISRLAPESAAHDLRYRAAEEVARDLLGRGGSRPGDHRLLAMALEGLALPGDREALLGSVAEYERAIRGDPGDSAGAERLARLCRDRLGDPGRGGQVVDALVAARPASARARLVAYRHFLAVRRNDRAVAELERATELDGSDPEVRLAAAGDAIRRGDGPAARRHLAAIAGPGRDDLRVRVMRGMVDFNEERPDEAVDGWRRGLLASGGTDADLTWWLAHALLRMGRAAEARPLVAQHRRLAGAEGEPLHRLLRAELDERSGHPARAIADLEWARDRVGPFWQAMAQMALGRCHEAIRDRSRALADYRRAGQLDPALPEPRIAAARLLEGRPDEAIREIEGGIELVPDDPGLRVALAGARLRQQAARPPADRSWAEFDRDLDLARRAAPGHSSLRLMQADRRALAGDLAGAVELLGRAAAEAPRGPSAWVAWAEGLDRLGRPEEALGVLERAAAADAAGDRAPIRVARARLLLARGRGREARDLLARGLEGLPAADRPAAWEALGRLEMLRGEAVAARAAFAEWGRLLPDDPRPRLASIELAEALGDAAAAGAAVEALRAIGGPEDVAWRLARSRELLGAGDDTGRAPAGPDPGLAEAERLLRGALVDAPEVPAAHLLLGRVLERRGELDEAIASYRRAWERGDREALPRLVGLLARLSRHDELASLNLVVPAARLDQLSAAAMLRGGDLGEARRFAERAGKVGEELPGVRQWQAAMLEAVGDREGAEAALRSIAEARPEEAEPWIALVRGLAAHGKAREAAAAVERARRAIRPGDLPTALARLRWAAGDRAAADREFRAALAARPVDVGLLVTASRFSEESGRRPEAVARLRAARAVAPGDRAVARRLAALLAPEPATWPEAIALVGEAGSPAAPAEDRLARALVLADAPDPARSARAVDDLEALVADLPIGGAVAASARENLIRLLLRGGRAARAAELAAVPAGAGADPRALALHAEALLRAGQLAGAGRQVDRLEAIAPGDPIAANLRARWLLVSARPGEAAAALERAVRERGDRPGAEPLGRAAFAALIAMGPGALDQAEGVARMVARARPSASWMVARVLARRGRPGEALDACRGAEDSGLADDRRGAAELAMEVATAPGVDPGLLPRAEALLEGALRGDPADYDVLVLSAMSRHLRSRFEEEARLYRAALEVRPADPTASNNLAWALSEHLGRPEQALAVLDAMSRRDGRLPGWALDTRGVVLTRLGRLDDAVRDLKEAGGERPAPAVLFHLARACLKANRLEEFRAYRDQARRSGIAPAAVDPSERAELASLMAR